MKDLRAAHHVFLSYAREDLALARRLAAALEAGGRTVAMDVTDIAPGDDWQAQLDRLLRGAAKLVFLATPASAGSPACQQELSAALSAGKPVLLVMTGQMKSADLPTAVQHLHYIRLSGEDPGPILPVLMAAIDLDLEWERRKAAFLARAAEKGALFHSRAELRSAETWAMYRPDGAAPVPEAILHLIARSRARRNRRGFGLFAVAGLAVVTLAALASYSWWQSERARAALTDSQRREAQLSVEPALRLSRDGWTFEALDQLRGILAVFPEAGLPSSILAPAEEIIHRAEAETAFPVPVGAQVFPGKDGAWILERRPAGWRLSLLRPDGSTTSSEIHFGSTMVAFADFADGPRAILANGTSQQFELEPKFRTVGEPEPLPETILADLCWANEATALFAYACDNALSDVAINGFLNRRGEYVQLVAPVAALPESGRAACLADDGGLEPLVTLGAQEISGDDSLYPEGCRAYPDQDLVITAAWGPPGTGGQRSNFDLVLVRAPEGSDRIACIDVGYWQDVDVSRSEDGSSLEFVLTDLTEIRQVEISPNYDFGTVDPSSCDELRDSMEQPAIKMPATPRFVRRFVADGLPDGRQDEILMAYMPDRNEIRLIRTRTLETEWSEISEPEPEERQTLLTAQAAQDRTVCSPMFHEASEGPVTLTLGPMTFQMSFDGGAAELEGTAVGSKPLGLRQIIPGYHLQLCMALSPDGRRLALVEGGGISVFAVEDGVMRPLWSQPAGTMRAALFLDDNRLVTGNANSLQLWTTVEGTDWQPRTLMTSPVAVEGFSLSPSGRRLVALLDVADSPDVLVVIDLSDGSVIARVQADQFWRPVLRVGFEGETSLFIRNEFDGRSLTVALPDESDLRQRVAALP
ncbi:toll/interleukin-1 receptor domain-containing protein [Pseudogemmobacter bohemicus]|uniref:toll/interleukin-1 receptor domain-containing protein n=1 Tax=Pseudogemmobacter bohemicus TaxID=2250708 RepID=UPI000DD3DF8C|nr:toll/interleukin-1 receptor domain-containing protein [Pseudogemmobacter bohemicus]